MADKDDTNMGAKWLIISKWIGHRSKTLQGRNEVGLRKFWYSLSCRENESKLSGWHCYPRRQILCYENLEQKINSWLKLSKIRKNWAWRFDLNTTSFYSGPQIRISNPWKIIFTTRLRARRKYVKDFTKSKEIWRRSCQILPCWNLASSRRLA